MRSRLAQGVGVAMRAVEPIRLRAARFVYEAWARSRLRGRVEAGVQFIGWITVEGTGNIHIGSGTRIGRRCFLETQGEGQIVIGRNCTINDHTVITAYDEVAMGDHVMMGEFASIRDAAHGMRLDAGPMRFQPHTAAPIHIGDDVWIGRGVCVLKGARIGSGAVIGANSVVTKDIPAKTIAVGTPARPVGERTP